MASLCTSAFDLTAEAGVEAYLKDTPFACTKAEALSGGLANFVFRLHLRQPHEDRATLILKHGRPYIKSVTSISFDTKRQIFEVEALRRIREWIPSTAFITVPSVYHFDEIEHAIIMNDCGPDSMTLKEYMQNGLCPVETAHRIGKEFGIFIGRLHAWGKCNKDVSEFFGGNEEAKRISSWVWYDKLLPTFDEGLEGLRDPDVILNSEERRALEKIAEESGNAMRKATGTFVMGDFFPGNVIVSFDERQNLKQLTIVDWEVCKPGLFGCELGQFCGDLILLTRFNMEICGSNANAMLENLLKAYTNHITPDLEMCRRAIVHLGAHLVTQAPRMGWKGKETIQSVVKDGLRLILDGYSAEKDWLENSPIGLLVKSVV